MAGRSGLRPPKDWKQRFLKELRLVPNVFRAARLAQVTTATPYTLRKKDAKFSAAWDEAVEAGWSLLEEKGHKLALNGVKKGVWKMVDGVPTKVEVQTEYSPQMMIHYLRVHYPHHREQQTIAHVGGGPDAPPIQTQALAPLLPKDLEDGV